MWGLFVLVCRVGSDKKTKTQREFHHCRPFSLRYCLSPSLSRPWLVCLVVLCGHGGIIDPSIRTSVVAAVSNRARRSYLGGSPPLLECSNLTTRKRTSEKSTERKEEEESTREREREKHQNTSLLSSPRQPERTSNARIFTSRTRPTHRHTQTAWPF